MHSPSAQITKPSIGGWFVAEQQEFNYLLLLDFLPIWWMTNLHLPIRTSSNHLPTCLVGGTSNIPGWMPNSKEMDSENPL